MDEAIQRSHELYPQCGGRWGEQKKTWFFSEGSSLKMRAIEREADIPKFQGWSIPWIGIDEAGSYPTDTILRRFAIACNRWGRGDVPKKRIRLTANPGGPGHDWLKTMFIDPHPSGFVPFEDEASGKQLMYIPAKIKDNKIGLERDPGYVKSLEGIGSKELVRAWLEGDWNAIDGAFFSEFSSARHVIPSFDIPNHCFKFRSFDWGGAKPFAVLWFAVSDGEPITYYTGQTIRLPRGCLVCYREWYGQEPGKPNVGLRMRNEDIAVGIVARDGNEELSFTTTDNLPFQDRGGIKIAETFYKGGVLMKRGDTSRIPGWQQLRSRLQGTEEGPLIVFFDVCHHTIRTLPKLQPDPLNAEDVDSDLEDHAPDAVRLACMERPLVWDRVELKSSNNRMTFNELLRWAESQED